MLISKFEKISGIIDLILRIILIILLSINFFGPYTIFTLHERIVALEQQLLNHIDDCVVEYDRE